MNQYIKTILLLLLTVSTGNLYAKLQGQAKIDSLLKELPRQKEDTNKVKLLNALSSGYSLMKPDEGIKYGEAGLALATKINWKKGIANMNLSLGTNNFYRSDYTKAREYWEKALTIFTEIGEKRGSANALGNIGNIYMQQADYSKAVEYYGKAVKMLEEAGLKKSSGIYIGNMGTVYLKQNDYPKALEYYFKALKIHEEAGNKNGIASTTGNIGIIYSHLKNYPKALEYYFKALKMNEEMGDKVGIASVCTGIGLVYQEQGNYLRALEYDKKALKIDEEIGSKNGIAISTKNIGIVYKKQQNYTMAIDYFQSSLKMSEELGSKYITAGNLCDIGTTYIDIINAATAKTGKITEVMGARELSVSKYVPVASIPRDKAALLAGAIGYINRGLAICKEINAVEFMTECYAGLSNAYKIKGDYKKAMEYGDSLKIIKDSVFSQENREKIAKMEDARKQYGDSVRAADAKIAADVKAAHRRNYELIGGGVLLLALGFIFVLRKNNKLLGKEKKQSENLLLNILPEEVATQLKQTGSAAARNFDNVTVLFTDFVNFTEASGRMKPEALIEELDTCFKKFDAITGKYSIEKIKTIGDAYLAVCGLPHPDPEHALNIIRAAQEINTFMQDREAKLGNSTFKIRIGIHTGSVIAGIVGDKKFAYDIWGDTVNTAARMEQCSEASKINISQTTYELVKDKISCEYRGEIDAKGKGMLKMYYVV